MKNVLLRYSRNKYNRDASYTTIGLILFYNAYNHAAMRIPYHRHSTRTRECPLDYLFCIFDCTTVNQFKAVSPVSRIECAIVVIQRALTCISSALSEKHYLRQTIIFKASMPARYAFQIYSKIYFDIR